VTKGAKKPKGPKRSEQEARPTSPVVEAAHLALRPRPGPAPDVLAAISAAAQLAWPQPAAAPDTGNPGHDAWRFSGRWWALPSPMRRARPWARR
jgi:hypothetical protein